MRGTDERTGSLFSYVDIEARVAADHPLRAIQELADGALARLDRVFAVPGRMSRPMSRPRETTASTSTPSFESSRQGCQVARPTPPPAGGYS